MLTGGMGIKALRKQERTSDRTIYKYFSLNYLSPRIIRTILDGTPPSHINLQVLFEIASGYPDFVDQEKKFFAE